MSEEKIRAYLLGFVVGGGAGIVGAMIVWVGSYLWVHQGTFAINLPLIVITGVVFLLTTLGLLTYSFSALGLANKDEALGLPSGSVRAVIALMLLVIFAIISIYLFSIIIGKNEDAAIDLAKQMFVLIGTLVTAVSSFYFGSSSIAAVTKPTVSAAGPNAVSVSPGNLKLGEASQTLTVSGTNLAKVSNVKLSIDGQEIPADAGSVVPGETSVGCKVTVPAEAKWGPWDVVVSDNANNFSSVPKSVTIGTKPADPH